MHDKLLPFLGRNFLAILVRFLGAASGILSIILISRYFGADTLGIVSFAQRSYQLILILGVFGFREVILKEYPSARSSNNEEVFSSSLGISILFILLLTILINIIPVDIINNLFDIEGAGVFIKIFSWGLVFHVASKILTFALLSINKVQLSLLLDGALINIILLILIALYWWLIGDLNYEYLGFMFLTSRVINWLYSIRVASKWKINFWRLKLEKEILNRSKKFFGISALYNLIQNVDLIVVAFILTPAELGIYAAASRISLIIKLMTFTFNTSLIPELLEAHTQDKNWGRIKRIISRNARIGLSVGSIFIIIQLLFGRQILSLFGAGFDSGYSILIIISICSVLQFTFSPFQIFLKMLGYEKKLLWLLLICLILLSATLVVGTIQFGLIGAASALLLSFSVLYAFELLFVFRIVKLNH